MVLVGEEGDVSQFEMMEVGLAVVSGRLTTAFVLHAGRRRGIRVNGQNEIRLKPRTYSLNGLVVHVSNLLDTVLVLAVLLLLLLLFLLQDVFLQC